MTYFFKDNIKDHILEKGIKVKEQPNASKSYMEVWTTGEYELGCIIKENYGYAVLYYLPRIDTKEAMSDMMTEYLSYEYAREELYSRIEKFLDNLLKVLE